MGKTPRDGIRATRWVALECSLVAVGLDPEAVVTARALLRSGRRLSAETERSLRTALEHHRNAMRCQRDAATVIQDLLTRDDDMDDGERARARLQLELRRRRWGAADKERFAQMAALQARREPGQFQRQLARPSRRRRANVFSMARPFMFQRARSRRRVTAGQTPSAVGLARSSASAGGTFFRRVERQWRFRYSRAAQKALGAVWSTAGRGRRRGDAWLEFYDGADAGTHPIIRRRRSI